MNEQFSAFLDNETTRDENDAVISALLRDETLRDSWSRQHQIRDALRSTAGDAAVVIDTQFSVRVMQAIRDDIAPAAAEPINDWQRDVNSGRTPTVVPMRRKRRRGHHWRNMAGLAVAASAAGVALFATQPLQQLMTPGTALPAAVQAVTQQASTMAAADSDAMPDLHFETVATANADSSGFDTPWQMANGFVRDVAARVDKAQAAVDHWSVTSPALANRLNDLLVEHNGLARGYGLGATTPAFVRVATYGQGLAQ